MDLFVKLAYDTIKYYIKNKKILQTYDESFENKNSGIIVKIENGERLKGESGFIFPTRKNTAIDIIQESINAGFFSYTYMPITAKNLDQHKITIYEFLKVETIKYIEDFKDWDGISITFNDESFIAYRKDYNSDIDMFDSCLKKANVDYWDIFLIEKFKVIIHQ